MSKIINEFILTINPFISDGMMTTLFVQNFTFVIGIFCAMPLICLLSFALWSIINTIREKRFDI
jgi:hypothetical protein